jgi:hypothetical protein
MLELGDERLTCSDERLDFGRRTLRRAKDRLRQMIEIYELWLGESERIMERWRTR